jgi:hypothetical protein
MNRLQLTFAALFITATVSAQKTDLPAGRQDFTGTWTLKDQKSISGTLYANGVPKQIKSVQDKQMITIEKVTANARGEDVTSTEKLNYDGKPFETTTPSKRKKIATLTWSKDGQSFIEKSDLYSLADASKVEITYIDTWKLEDGKLIFIRKAENFGNGEIWESKSIYEKVK